MNDIYTMKALISTLNSASSLYYNTGTSPYSDQQFDAMMEELKAMEQITGVQLSNSPLRNVGAPVLDSIQKVDNQYRPMLSLDKVHSDEEVDNFADGHDILGMIKLDGLSIRLIYEKGQLILAHTRGNGYVGSNITEHIKHFTNVPLSLIKDIDIIVDGEAIIKLNDFEKINQIKADRETISQVLVMPMENEMEQCLTIANDLRNAGINTDVYLEQGKIKKKMKYADRWNIPYVIIVGEEEVKNQRFALKNMKTGVQKELTVEEIINELR